MTTDNPTLPIPTVCKYLLPKLDKNVRDDLYEQLKHLLKPLNDHIGQSNDPNEIETRANDFQRIMSNFLDDHSGVFEQLSESSVNAKKHIKHKNAKFQKLNANKKKLRKAAFSENDMIEDRKNRGNF